SLAVQESSAKKLLLGKEAWWGRSRLFQSRRVGQPRNCGILYSNFCHLLPLLFGADRQPLSPTSHRRARSCPQRSRPRNVLQRAHRELPVAQTRVLEVAEAAVKAASPSVRTETNVCRWR